MTIIASLSLTLSGCLSEKLDGESVRAGAFLEAASAVNLLGFGGLNWTESDTWVVWSGPATLRFPDGYQPCADTERIANYLARKDPERGTLLADTSALTCLEKPGEQTGRWLLSHSSQVHWWRAWDHG